MLSGTATVCSASRSMASAVGGSTSMKVSPTRSRTGDRQFVPAAGRHGLVAGEVDRLLAAKVFDEDQAGGQFLDADVVLGDVGGPE